MAEPHVMDALRGKRSELSGIVSHLEQQIVQRRASLVRLDAAMRLFDPDLMPEETGYRQLREALVGFRGVDMQESGWWFRRASDVMKAAV